MIPRLSLQVRNESAKSELKFLALDADDAGTPVPGTQFSKYGLALGDGNKSLHWNDVLSLPIFAFAGIWRTTERGNGYGFLTTDPNNICRYQR
ncbi:hypothetical protein [Sphingomonas faeni]|uniref:hypothetical protein n=1 Tax=Sphingomonas faeni TaxID=185950 RepID=UPI003359A577